MVAAGSGERSWAVVSEGVAVGGGVVLLEKQEATRVRGCTPPGHHKQYVQARCSVATSK